MGRFICLFALLLVGCAGVVTDRTTSRLQPGMTVDEARKVMGAPSGTQFMNNQLVWKYSTWRPFVGYVPLYVFFDSRSGRLISWQESMSEYYANQTLGMSAVRPFIPQQVNVNANVNQTVDGTITHYVR